MPPAPAPAPAPAHPHAESPAAQGCSTAHHSHGGRTVGALSALTVPGRIDADASGSDPRWKPNGRIAPAASAQVHFRHNHTAADVHTTRLRCHRDRTQQQGKSRHWIVFIQVPKRNCCILRSTQTKTKGLHSKLSYKNDHFSLKYNNTLDLDNSCKKF